MTFIKRLFLCSAVAAVSAIPIVHAAQTPPQTPPASAQPAPAPASPAALAPADATALLGDWTISAESPMGPASYLLTVKVTEGKVVGEMSSDTMAKTTITDITKRTNAVVLRYSFDYQGMAVPTVVTLTPDGETMAVVFDFADGAFTMTGKATKKKLATLIASVDRRRSSIPATLSR